MFWRAMGKDDDCRLSRHLDNMCVVLGTDGVVNFSQVSLCVSGRFPSGRRSFVVWSFEIDNHSKKELLST